MPATPSEPDGESFLREYVALREDVRVSLVTELRRNGVALNEVRRIANVNGALKIEVRTDDQTPLGPLRLRGGSIDSTARSV